MRLRGTFHHARLDEAGVLKLRSRQAISEPFEIAVEVLHPDPEVDLEGLLWSEASIRIEDLDRAVDPIDFHGCIEEAAYLRPKEEGHVYGLRLRPKVHGLAYRARSRVFLEKDVIAIARQVLTDAGIPAGSVTWPSPPHAYPMRARCVQHAESELDFVARLFEQEGIYFWFDHQASGHKWVLGDHTAGEPGPWKPIAAPAAVAFSRWAQADRESVTDLVFETELEHDAYATRDWNFEHPEAPLAAEGKSDLGRGLERYEWPGGFDDINDGNRFAKNRLAEAERHRGVLRGQTTARRFRPGHTFSLTEARPTFLQQDWLLVVVEHEFDAPLDGQPRYVARFEAVPGASDFRPARRTPCPEIAGEHTAVVTTPSGEEIEVDKYGRIKLHPFWDRERPLDDTCSSWIRVMQQNTSGAMLLPRVGWELGMAYLDGDPDRPVALQKLYNQETLPPYGLPGAIAQSSLQSASSPGGGGTNEVRLDDSAGAMELFVHASKDYKFQSGHDTTVDVAVDSSHDVGLELRSDIGASEDISVTGTQGTSVTGDSTTETTGDTSESIGAMDDWGIGKNLSIKVDGSRDESIGGLMNVLANQVNDDFLGSLTRKVGGLQAVNAAKAIVEAVGGSKTELIGGAKLELISKTKSEDIGAAKALTSGAVQIKTGTDISFEAIGAIAITVGGAITETCGEGWALAAKRVQITAAGGATLEAGGSKLDLAGSTLSLDASSFGASGGPELKLKGTINYEEP